MNRLLPALAAATLCIMSLSGCSSAQNEKPCKDFEATYNSIHLRDKVDTRYATSKEYSPSLKQLGDTARADEDKASGDVQNDLRDVAGGQELYARAVSDTTGSESDLHARVIVEQARDKLVTDCKASGYPIQLEPDYASR